MHKRIARLYLRKLEAGIFEAPPKLLNDIKRFMIQRYAGHLLAKTEERLERLQGAGGSSFEDYDKQLRQSWKDVMNFIGNDSQNRRPTEFPLRPDLGKSIVLVKEEKEMTSKNWRGESYTDMKEVITWYYTENGTKRGAEYSATTYSVRDKLGKIYNKAIQDMHKDRNRMERAEGEGEGSFVELNLLRRELLNFTNKPKTYKSVTKTKLKVDISAWPMLDKSFEKARIRMQKRLEALQNQVKTLEQDLSSMGEGSSFTVVSRGYTSRGLSLSEDPPIVITKKEGSYVFENNKSSAMPLESMVKALNFQILDGIYACEDSLKRLTHDHLYDVLKSKDINEITVVLDFNGHTSRGGVWMPSKRELQVDVAREAVNVAEWQAILKDIIRVSRHESQHVGQSIIGILTNLKHDKGGIPSKSLRNLVYTPSGVPDTKSRTRYRNRKEHALQDVEFYTRLEDDIGRARDILKKVPPRYHASMIRVFTDAATPSDQVDIKDLNLNLRPFEFFKALKSNERGKWEKAVKEFVSALK